MMLCLAESLLSTGSFQPTDVCTRFVAWWQHGHMSSNGRCFDIGTGTLAALKRFVATGVAVSEDGRAEGNGSLMRIAPVPALLHRHPALAIDIAARQSQITHNSAAAVDACRYFTGTFVDFPKAGYQASDPTTVASSGRAHLRASAPHNN